VHVNTGLRRAIEYAHSNARPIATNRIPEKRRTAPRAKPSPHPFRRLEPSDILVAFDRHGRTGHVGRHEEVTRIFPACGAMTGVGTRKISLHTERNRAARTGTGVGHLVTNSLDSLTLAMTPWNTAQPSFGEGRNWRQSDASLTWPFATMFTRQAFKQGFEQPCCRRSRWVIPPPQGR